MQVEEDGTAKVVGPHRRKKHSVLQNSSYQAAS